MVKVRVSGKEIVAAWSCVSNPKTYLWWWPCQSFLVSWSMMVSSLDPLLPQDLQPPSICILSWCNRFEPNTVILLGVHVVGDHGVRTWDWRSSRQASQVSAIFRLLLSNSIPTRNRCRGTWYVQNTFQSSGILHKYTKQPEKRLISNTAFLPPLPVVLAVESWTLENDNQEQGNSQSPPSH